MADFSSVKTFDVLIRVDNHAIGVVLRKDDANQQITLRWIVMGISGKVRCKENLEKVRKSSLKNGSPEITVSGKDKGWWDGARVIGNLTESFYNLDIKGEFDEFLS